MVSKYICANGRHYTAGQVAQMIGVAPRTVSKWCDSKKINSFRLPGSEARRILQKEIVRFLRDNDMPMPQELWGPTALLVSDDRSIVDRLRQELGDRILVAETAFVAGRLYDKAGSAVVVADTRLGGGIAREVLGSFDAAVTARILLQAEDDSSAPEVGGVAVEGWRRPFDVALLAERLRVLLKE